MEAKASQFHGKREEVNNSHETLSTSSDGKFSEVSKGARHSLYEFSLSPHLNRPPKRAKSLKESLKKANIDFPGMHSSCYSRSILSPLPEPVEEDASEDSYVRLNNVSNPNIGRKQKETLQPWLRCVY